jgi:hypothetical protein
VKIYSFDFLLPKSPKPVKRKERNVNIISLKNKIRISKITFKIRLRSVQKPINLQKNENRNVTVIKYFDIKKQKKILKKLPSKSHPDSD